MKFDGNKQEHLMEKKHFTGSMPLLTINHTFNSCGGPEAFTATFEKCGVKLAQECRKARSRKRIGSELPTPDKHREYLKVVARHT